MICLAGDDGPASFAAGVCEGRIAEAPRGSSGFGYDPVFVPDDGDGRTFAEMSSDEKHAWSHRGRAFRTLADEVGPFLSEEEMRAVAASIRVVDQDTGDLRAARPADYFPPSPPGFPITGSATLYGGYEGQTATVSCQAF